MIIALAAQRFSLDELQRGKHYGATWKIKNEYLGHIRSKFYPKIAEQVKKDLLEGRK